MRLLYCLTFACLLSTNSAFAEGLPVQLRYPVDAARVDTDVIATANERSGTVSVVDVGHARVLDEIAVGQRVSGLVSVRPGRLIAIESKHGEAVALEWKSSRLREVSRLRFGGDPVDAAVDRSGTRVAIVSRWSRKIDVLGCQKVEQLTTIASIPLPFPAGCVEWLGDGDQLVVAEAFGGRLAVVDLEQKKIVSVRSTQGHNTAALVWDEEGKRLLVAQQILAETLPVTFDNIQWGALLKNVVRIIEHGQLFESSTNLATQTRVISLGQEGDGSADPTAILPLREGSFAVALGGAHEVVLVESTGLVVQRLALAQRPIALLAGSNPNFAMAISQFGNAVQSIDLQRKSVEQTVSLGPSPPLSSAQRGEQLFYDARLSLEKWMSCHSCHTHGHTHGLRADTLGDGTFGAPKRTLTLLGTRDTDRWAWNGEIKELHDQVHKSIETSMHGTATADDVYDLTSYLHSLAPPPPLKMSPSGTADRAFVERGRAVFEKQRCNQCHIGPLTYTSHDVYDVGMPDELGHAKFNPPSLRGAGQASRLFHDGRATSLDDVLDVFGHQLREPLTDDDRAALLRFLRSL